MAEFSMPWETINGVGDGAFTYSQDEAQEFFTGFLDNGADSGVVSASSYHVSPFTGSGFGHWGGLQVESDQANRRIFLHNGHALILGMPYYLLGDGLISGKIFGGFNPAVGDTGFRLVLRADWSTSTIRPVILSSTDGDPSFPALTQTPGTVYEIPLCSFIVEVGGTVIKDSNGLTEAVNDERNLITLPGVGSVANHVSNGWVTAPGGPPDRTYFALPANFNHAVFTIFGEASTTGIMYIRLNRDSSSNDAFQVIASSSGYQGSVDSISASHTAQMDIGTEGGVARIYMPNYKDTNFRKMLFVTNIYYSGGWQMASKMMVTNLTSAISEVRFLMASGGLTSQRIACHCWR